MGLIGSYVYQKISEHSDYNVEIVFVYDVDKEKLQNIPPELVLADIGDFETRNPDMICELANYRVSELYGPTFLGHCDYFMVSVTALGNSKLEETLKEIAVESNTRLFVPHGGAMGFDAIIEGRSMWEEVEIIMIKNPINLDFSFGNIDPDTIKERTELYNGPTRGVCSLFPRNVNTHATFALAGIGLDKTHSVLIADPALSTTTVEIRAHGGGVELRLCRTEEITGVSGASTPWSVLRSILSTAPQEGGLHFC